MYNETLWIFSSENPMSIPSYIVGGIMPADYLKIKKVIYLKHTNARKFLLEHKPKIIILSKALHDGILDLAKEARSLDIKVISIFDDWHFENTQKVIQDRSNLNRELTNLSKIIIAKTDYAAKIIEANTMVLPQVIPDCIRYKTLSPISSFKNPINISWFGNYTNHKTIIKAIDEISVFDHKINLQVITNKIEKIKDLLKNKKKAVSIKYFEWSLDLHKHIENSDSIILPLFKNNKSGVKSSNRIVDSLNMGRFVIINENEQFKEFNKFCFFGNIGEGLSWIKNNEKEAIKKITEGQKYVIEKYSLDKICSEWKKIINKC